MMKNLITVHFFKTKIYQCYRVVGAQIYTHPWRSTVCWAAVLLLLVFLLLLLLLLSLLLHGLNTR